ncbi:DUF1800 family protein [Pseudomaricurvus sp. HS19]|uniref:DUF1800 domain-containing protein n=1 Tax=Pseudomaricurvus sp. HS19 TaxID=2692626 RepID=UPI0013680898|nr:DUF1800 domain-containing protein [Pseudomaricurvus sp. HS19]MYM65128.1 DUF1800 family protein [Pseudomaricurvus sp. HS19]
MSLQPCRLLICLCLCLSGFGVSPQALELNDARHLSLRAAFGPNLMLINRFQALSREEMVTELISADIAVFFAPMCASNIVVSASLMKSWSDVARVDYQKMKNLCNSELQERASVSLIESPAVLRERMTLFWHNHFATAVTKVGQTSLLYQQHSMLHRQSLGNFRVLLHSVLNDAAMLLYLDNANNSKHKPNENLARELLELFTLGEGHYTENDIKEVARALTGQSVDRDNSFAVRFYPERHDYGAKTIFGETGHYGVEGVAELILRQPQTARFITRKLWLEFVSEPDEATINRLASRFAKDWNIKALVRGILLSDTFWKDQGRMIKSPVELVIGAERLLPGQQVPPDAVAPLLSRLGQSLFNPPNVRGWPGGKDWIDSSRMMLRVNFADRLLRGLEQEATPEELAFLCEGDGPARFAALPDLIEVDRSAPCMEQLSVVLTDPVWQLK